MTTALSSGAIPPALRLTFASGIADAFHSLHMMLGWLAIITIGGLTLCALITHNRLPNTIAFALCIPFAIMLVPWSAHTLDFDDPDLGRQYRELRVLAYASYTAIGLTILGVVYFAGHQFLGQRTGPVPDHPDNSQAS